MESTAPLSTLRSGEDGVVLCLFGGKEFRSKMLSMGILPGKTIAVAKGEQNQPYILRVDDSRVMLDWDALKNILVKSQTNSKPRRV